jgi:hypothetical protein
MDGKQTVRAELEEQRCLIEQQQVEILRQKHHLELQRRRVAHLEAELDAIKGTFQRAAPIIDAAQPPQRQRPPSYPSHE